MDLISQFIENYKKKINFYETAGRMAARQLESALQAAGIRAIVTSRAKAPGRLKSKVLIRNSRRSVPYKNMREIYEDIADLCGVRVSAIRRTALLTTSSSFWKPNSFRNSPRRLLITSVFPVTGPTITGPT